jgi:cytochrome c553
VRSFLCEGTPPSITSFADLQRGLKLQGGDGDTVYGYGLQPILLAHSTALSGRLVSPINPRAIFSNNGVLLTFQRGVQQIEIAARDRSEVRHNFYLLTFEQACSSAEAGCSPGDLFTAKVESNWTNVVVRDDEELKNTPSDCRQCHQRARESTTLLMRELEAPWTHFFNPSADAALDTYAPGIDGGLFTAQYQDAKGNEPYGNAIVGAPFPLPSGFVLETLVDKPQALFFDSAVISSELHGVFGSPVQDPAKRSATWDASYAAFKRGEQLPLPYFAPVVTDPEKLAALTSAYRRYAEGAMGADELPDLADVFPDDAQTRAEIGLQVEPEATPAEALVQACGACHNDVLDQSISRARFNVGVSHLSREELDVALERLNLSANSPGVMPPREARQLTPAVKKRLVEYLRRGEFPEADIAFLDHAATRGMSGGGQPWPPGALPKDDFRRFVGVRLDVNPRSQERDELETARDDPDGVVDVLGRSVVAEADR